MKSTLYTLFALFLLIACEIAGEEIVVINPKTSKNSIVLKINKVINDSTIELGWTKYNRNNFKEYRLVRNAQVLRNGTFSNTSQVIKSFSHKDSLTFKERNMPFSNRINYSVSVITDTINNLTSSVSYGRPGTFKEFTYNDVLINISAKNLYLYDRNVGSITLYNYETNKEIKKVSLNSGLGFCALGDFGGGQKNELYVPTMHGWLYILDAFTLETKDKIFIGGEDVTSVIALSGKLFISSSDKSYSFMGDNSLKIYDRGLKKLTGRTGYWVNTRLLYLESSDIELIDITTNLSPTDLNYYKFNSAGIPIEKKKDTYHGDYPLDASLIRSFPDGSKFITASSGTIYSRDLKYVKSLSSPFSGKYNDFALNHSGTSIYAALKQQKKVEEIAYATGQVTKTFTTLFFPFKIFRDGNQLICVTISNNNPGSYYFIEKFNL